MNKIRQTTNNAWAFLWTEMEPKAKPHLLFVADRILNPIDYTEINFEGFPVKKTRVLGNNHDIELSNFCMLTNIASFGFGIFGAHAFAGSLAISSFPGLIAFTAISFSAKILVENTMKLTEEKFPNIVIISKIAVLVLTLLGTFFFGIYLVFALGEPLFTFVISMSTTLQRPMESVLETTFKNTSFILATNTIKFIAFNLFAGALLKFIAYKIYPSVQKAYDNFFLFLKAGEIDPRVNSDIVLRHSFKNLTPTLFNYIPLELLPQIRESLSTKEAMDLRSCSKVFFSLTSNRDILKMRICENFIFTSANMNVEEIKKKLENIQYKLLCLLYTNPLNSRMVPDFNKNSVSPSLDYIMKNPQTYWIKLDNTTWYVNRVKEKFYFIKGYDLKNT